jgi:branched-chain amino acid transport system permease protein
MMMLGGAGTVMGPVLGAFLLELISETVWGQFLTIHMLILGTIVIGVVIFIPRGMLHLFRQRFSLSALIRNIKNQSI